MSISLGIITFFAFQLCDIIISHSTKTDFVMQKIAPRDIFNDANFYKNLSYLLTYMKDDVIPGLEFYANESQLLSPGFLSLNPEDGDLICPSGTLYDLSSGGELTLTRPMNSRDAFPVYVVDDDYGFTEVFQNSGFPHHEILDLTRDAESSKIHADIDAKKVMGYSVAMKGVGKVALLVIDNMASTSNLHFDEAQYSEKGLTFEEEGGFYYLEHDELITCAGDVLHLRSPVLTNENNLWPLEFSVDGESYKPVYSNNGELSPDFLSHSVSPENKVSLEAHVEEPALRNKMR